MRSPNATQQRILAAPIRLVIHAIMTQPSLQITGILANPVHIPALPHQPALAGVFRAMEEPLHAIIRAFPRADAVITLYELFPWAPPV